MSGKSPFRLVAKKVADLGVDRASMAECAFYTSLGGRNGKQPLSQLGQPGSIYCHGLPIFMEANRISMDLEGSFFEDKPSEFLLDNCLIVGDEFEHQFGKVLADLRFPRGQIRVPIEHLKKTTTTKAFFFFKKKVHLNETCGFVVALHCTDL